jgi:hypothetical protein
VEPKGPAWWETALNNRGVQNVINTGVREIIRSRFGRK